MAQASQAPSGPPYLPQIAIVGGIPTVDVDVPVLSVFIFIYLIGAISNMTIFQINRRKGHFFPMSAALFGFCMARMVTSALRISWATQQTNARLALAAQIFTNVGIIIIYIIAVNLSMRILRATHPKLGWNKLVFKLTVILYALLACAIILVITFTILSFYTLNESLRITSLWVQRGAIIYLLVFNITPLFILSLSLLLPRSSERENFGTGSIQSKCMILGAAIFFILFNMGFRVGTVWTAPRLASDPAWFQSKAAFYVFIFSFEIILLYLLLLTRFDQRFWVPDGSKKPGDYSETMSDHDGDDSETISDHEEKAELK